MNAILFHIRDLSGIGGELRPGIVHRIDKMTSGLIVIAKNDFAHRALAEQMKSHAAGRVYLAIVDGNIREDFGTVNAPMVGIRLTESAWPLCRTGGKQLHTGMCWNAMAHIR